VVVVGVGVGVGVGVVVAVAVVVVVVVVVGVGVGVGVGVVVAVAVVVVVVVVESLKMTKRGHKYLAGIHKYTKTLSGKMMTARAMVIARLPYFGTALHSLVPHEVDKIRRKVVINGQVHVQEMDTFGVTESGFLLYTAKALEDFSDEQLVFVLGHEVMHVLLDHAKRAREESYDAHISNIGQDIFINDQLREAKLSEAPPTFCWPEAFNFHKGLTTDQYYWLLIEKKHEQQAKKEERIKAGQCTQCGQNDHKHAPRYENPGDENPVGGCPNEKPGQIDKEPDLTQMGEAFNGDTFGHCGSGAGNELENEADLPQEHARSGIEMDRMRQQAAREAKEYAKNNPGRLPGGIGRWVDLVLTPPKVSWKDHLRRVCRRAYNWVVGQEDYRYGRMHRRQGSFGFGPGSIILPTMVAPCPNIVIAVDTSASMAKSELEIGLREIHGIFSALKASVMICACDATVQELKEVKNWREAARALKGGGGTNFIPIFNAIEALRVRPDIVIVVTDGWGNAPSVAPKGYKTIWLEVGKGSTSPCDWGTHIKLEN
jgi:predicted metal-dependent peptidase